MSADRRRPSSRRRRKLQSVLYLLEKQFGPEGAECVRLRHRLDEVEDFISGRLEIPDGQLAQMVWDLIGAPNGIIAMRASHSESPEAMPSDMMIAGRTGRAAEGGFSEHDDSTIGIAGSNSAATLDNDWAQIIQVQNQVATSQQEMVKSQEEEYQRGLRMELRNQVDLNLETNKRIRSQKLEERKQLEERTKKDEQLEMMQKQQHQDAEIKQRHHISQSELIRPEPFPDLLSAAKSTAPFALDDDFNAALEFSRTYSKQYRPHKVGPLRQSASSLLHEARLNAISLYCNKH